MMTNSIQFKYFKYNFIYCNIHIADKSEIQNSSYVNLLTITNLLLDRIQDEFMK